MSENDQKMKNQRAVRGGRIPSVIEGTASELVESNAAATAGHASELNDLRTQDASSAKEAIAKDDATSTVQTSEDNVIRSSEDPVAPPIVPTRHPSMLAPMAIAAVVGGLLGTTGSVLLSRTFPVVSPQAIPEPAADRVKLQQQLSDIDALQKRLQALEVNAGKPVADAALTARINSLESILQEFSTRSQSSISNAPSPVDLSPLTQRLGALEKDLKSVEGKTEAGAKAAEPKIAALAQQIEQATKRMSAASAAPYFSATQALAQAFHSGAPFVTELTAMELLGANATDLASLRMLSEKGAPTVSQLTARFGAQATKLAQGGEAPTGGGIQASVLSVVQRFVKIRPAGEIGGSSVPDIVTTIEAALGRGDLATALSAWRKLPEPARQSSLEWAQQLEARAKAAQAISTLQSQAIAALRTAKP
jgi:hypothetical protein